MKGKDVIVSYFSWMFCSSFFLLLFSFVNWWFCVGICFDSLPLILFLDLIHVCHEALCFILFLFVSFFNDFYFFHYSWFIVSYQISHYSKKTPSYIHIYIYICIYILFLTLSSIMLHHTWLDIVPSAIQQDLITYPFQRQWFASINPRFPILPTPSHSSLATTSLFSKSMSFFSVESFICALY